MKDNKLYKVLRIIFLTLAIISLVFTLCKKVGLCASGGSSGSDSILYLEDYKPVPYGNRLGYASDFDVDDTFRLRIFQSIIDAGYTFSYTPIALIYEEDTDDYIKFRVVDSNRCSFSGNSYATTNTVYFNKVYQYMVTYTFSTDSFSASQSSVNNATSNITHYISENPAYPTSGSEYLVYKNTYIFNYPFAVYSDGEIINLDTFGNTGSSASKNGFPFFYKVVDESEDSTEFADFPDFESLPNPITDSSNPDYNLYSWLNGQNEQNYNYTKSIFDLIKGFFSWVVVPFDSEAASSSLESIQVISDIRSLNNVIGTAGIFNWSDVTPASRVAFTFDFGGAVLPHQEYEINFDWYTGTVKTLILSILLTFLVVGLLVTIINNIPSMIHGHSGDSGGGSN